MSRIAPLALAVLTLVPAAIAQENGVRGDWRTPGSAVVRIAACGPDLCATLLQLEPNAPIHLDENNPDPALHTRKLCGLQIGYGFHLTDPTHAEGGHLYDPKSGRTYRGAMASHGSELNLRGYVGIKLFGRTETWTRLPSPSPTCS